MKQIYVILAFHAHEPLWDLPKHVLEELEDREMKQTVLSENWIEKRSREGRDIYQDLIQFSRGMGVPVALEATNELLLQIASFMPDTFEALKEAYQVGMLCPLYGNAYHTHVALLGEEELREEIELNKQFVHQTLGAPEPKYKGLFPTEGSLDAHKLDGIEAAGIDYVIFPHLNTRKAHYVVEGKTDVKYEPFFIGAELIALPRHFSISQDIWRPITRMKPDEVKPQGYLLGRFHVFEEEYREGKTVTFPISREEAIAEYRTTLEAAIEEAPSRGLLLYIQDLELMDFGDVALDLMRSAWKEIQEEKGVNLSFVTPDQYIQERVEPRRQRLGRVKFHQISWAPEIRLVLRSDGHYPPLNAGEFRAIDLTQKVFKRWPFIFWETGRYLVDVCNSLLASFGFSLQVGEATAQLSKAGYRFSTLDVASRLALHSRFMKRACNWGWRPEEGRQKRPFLHAYCLFSLLLADLERQQDSRATEKVVKPLPVSSLEGLARILEIMVDTRVHYLELGFHELERLTGQDRVGAFNELERARAYRNQAAKHIAQARQYNASLEEGVMSGELVSGLISELRDYCRAVFMATDCLQRAWGYASDNIDTMLTCMYDYLYELYPPRLPDILESTLSEIELENASDPELV